MANIAEDPKFANMCREHLIADEGSLLHQTVIFQLKALQAFSQTLENLISAENDRVAATYSGSPEDYPGWWLQDVVACQLRQSFVAACLDTTTYLLNFICQDVATILQKDNPDLHREPIKQARRFFCEVGFSDPSASQWDEMQDLYTFRNAVVHSMAMTPDGKQVKKFDRFLKRAPGITSRSGTFDLEAKFSTYVYKSVTNFFEVLQRELVKLCHRNATHRK